MTQIVRNGGKIYTLAGKIINTNEKYEDKYIFRKMTNNKIEITLCKILMQNPHKNIVKIYKINEPDIVNGTAGRIDMELLNTDLINIDISTIRNRMQEVKIFLQGIGIMYIDWKPDNIGLSDDGEIKIFDLDASGLINIKTNKWIINPDNYYSYRIAIQAGYTEPNEIDDYSFDIGLQPW